MTSPRYGIFAPLLLLGLAAGCIDDTPTSSDSGLVPVDAETFEVILPAEDFIRDLRIDRGYGLVSELGTADVRLDEDGFEIRSLLRFGPLPGTINVVPPGGGASESDSTFTTIGGRLVLRFDTAQVRGDGPWTVEVASVVEDWHPQSARWDRAIDTLGNRVDWSEPGAGSARVVGSATWPGPDADSLVVDVDSTAIREWTDSGSEARGIRLRMTEPGQGLRVQAANLRTDNISEINPDTVILLQPQRELGTMIYNPEPEADGSAFVVGGAPAFRTSFRMELPDSVEVTSASLCGSAQTCRIGLIPDRVVFAGLNFTTIEAERPGFIPSRTMLLDLRPVLAADRLPRSPLGAPINPDGVQIPPSAFMPDSTRTFELSMSRYFRDLLRPSTEGRAQAPSTVSLLVPPEPRDLGVVRFGASDPDTAPFLRIILTTSPGVSVR